MASTYAGRLKKGVHYGTCGLPEIFDSSREMLKKASSLVLIGCVPIHLTNQVKAQLLKNSKHAVIFTVRFLVAMCTVLTFQRAQVRPS